VSGFPQTGRDADTFRPIVATTPPSPSRSEESDDDDDAAPRRSTVLAFAVVVGAVVGGLVVWAYVEDHPKIPLAAREGTSATASPSSEPPREAPSTPPAVAPQADLLGAGFIGIVAPRGSLIFDGERFVGTAPLMHATNTGLHVIRVHHGASKPQTFTIEVRPSETTPVVATFEKQTSPKRRAQPGRH
jgi:hypothetical protein